MQRGAEVMQQILHHFFNFPFQRKIFYQFLLQQNYFYLWRLKRNGAWILEKMGIKPHQLMMK